MIEKTQSLRTRLTTTYAIALTLGLCVFAIFSLTTIEETLKTTLDARMSAAARALSAALAVHNGRIPLNERTERRLLSILGVQQNCAIVLSNGTILMESAIMPPSVRHVAHAPTPNVLTFSTVGGPDAPLRVVAAPIVNGSTHLATTLIWRPVDFVSDYERSAEGVFAATLVVVVTVAIIIGGAVARRGLEPLRSMAGIASEIEAHDLSRRLGDAARCSEISEFCTTFDRMLDRLQAAFERQRQFIADASHDLRAPLAVARAEVELALRTGVVPEYRATLLSIGDEVAELESLIDALLRAARVDAESIAHQSINLSELSLVAIKRMERFAAARSVRITSDVAPGRFVVGDHDVLERAIASLLHNAAKFAKEGGQVKLSLTEATGSAILSIMDDGPGFSEAALTHAFNRFWRDDLARSRGGSGLGLAIAKASVERFGGEIQLENLESGGAKVTVTLVAEMRDSWVATRDTIFGQSDL